MDTSSSYLKLLNSGLAQQYSSPCPTCDDLQGSSSKPVSISLENVSVSAENGCNSCMVIHNSYLHINDQNTGDTPDQMSGVNLQVPLLDAGFPLGLASSDADGWYSWDEVFTESSAAKAPWPLVGQATERKKTALESISVLKGWIDTCQASHPECAMRMKAMPTRVLDVQGDTISLHVSGDELEPYAALSHCWGKFPVIQTHRSTFDDRISDIPWTGLSKTFQDAITTTRLLGLKYLWIDSLCIVQDDLEDWARESGSMASIYESARIVIAASDSSDGRDGFLKERPPTTTSKTVFKGINENGESYQVKIRQGDDHRWYGNLLPPRSQIVRDSSPLFTRGWAFQERLLATRYVQFRAQELIWECRTSVWCECGTLSRPSQQRMPYSKKTFCETLQNQDPEAIFSLWSQIINTYASKVLTSGSDILPALSGLAKRFQESSTGPKYDGHGIYDGYRKLDAGDYLAGLWKNDLPFSLLWEAYGTRAVPYRAPSWSWASIDTSNAGSSLVSESTPHRRASLSSSTFAFAYVNKAFCETCAVDPTGAVSSGFLTITGPTLNIIAIARELAKEYESPFDWSAKIFPTQKRSDHWHTTETTPTGYLTLHDPGLKPASLLDEMLPSFLSPRASTVAVEKKEPVQFRGPLRLNFSTTPNVSLSCEPILGSITQSERPLRADQSLRQLSLSLSALNASVGPTEVESGVGELDRPSASTEVANWSKLYRHKALDRRLAGEVLSAGTFTFGFHADMIIPDLHLEELICLLIASVGGAPRALVLRRARHDASGNLLYERVGLIDRIIYGSGVRSNGWMPLFKDASTRTIIIV